MTDERTFWQTVRPGPIVPSSDNRYKVEVPAHGDSESVWFSDLYTALHEARLWSLEDRILVLVWDKHSGMYIQRYDGRPR